MVKKYDHTTNVWIWNWNNITKFNLIWNEQKNV
jgi:hypothetical protein